jgi:hypothetical protein
LKILPSGCKFKKNTTDSSREALYKCLQSELVYERRSFPAGIEESFFVVCAVPTVGFIFLLHLASLVKVMIAKSPFIGQQLEK